MLVLWMDMNDKESSFISLTYNIMTQWLKIYNIIEWKSASILEFYDRKMVTVIQRVQNNGLSILYQLAQE